MRHLLCAALCCLCLGQAIAGDAAARTPPRVVPLDWGLASTLFALGVKVPALAEKSGYADWVGPENLSDDVVDLGLRLAPDMERLRNADPDLILITPQFSSIVPRIETIAKTKVYATFTPEKTPLSNSIRIARELGELLNASDRAEQLVASTNEALADLRRSRETKPEACPVLVVNFVDERHVRVFADGSLYDDVLKAGNIENAWRRPTNYWGFGTAPASALLDYPDAALIVIGPTPPQVQRILDASGGTQTFDTLLHHLPAVEAGRLRIIPAIWSFGGLPEAARLAKALTSANLPECPHD
ncbi:ABC transporter substrate-binding protein [Roseibium litorale]|uniref:ABC transporter substrate-binding protein n=1 Tax=Roseibium litorale TaxID=2803841 RepID=A0ABR9CSB3_9HYPH|nr:ABC transporter substrate-binding protein [Roseibium litorale]MBD8893643.1 ABC transporter substrate-binding protein [Roseibium litorale]